MTDLPDFWIDTPVPEVQVGRVGQMYASCSVYACGRLDGCVIDLGGIEVRLCRRHALHLTRQLRVQGIR